MVGCEDGSRAERWQSLMQLSQEDLVAELGRYAGLLSADDPRADLLRAMQRFLDAKQKESSGEEWDANAKMQIHREIGTLADQALASAADLRRQHDQSTLKAWNEFVDAHDIRFEWVAFGYMAAVVRVL